MNDFPALRPEDGIPVPSPMSAYPSHLDADPKTSSSDDAEALQLQHLEQANRLLERARARRERALTNRDLGISARHHDFSSRDLCVVQTTVDGRTVTNHVFSEVPRLGALIARTGPDVFVLTVRVQVPERDA